MNNDKGFTLVELLAIITILGIILAIAIPAFQHHVTSARNDAYDALITTSKTAAQNKYIDEGLPSRCQKYDIEEDLYKKGYMDKPADPASTSTNCNGYVYVKSDNTLDSIENYKILVSLGCSTYKKDVCKDSGGESCTFSEDEKNECGYENISGHDEPITPDTPEPTNPPMIKVTSERDNSTFRNDTYREKIKTITLDDRINKPENTIKSWDIGAHQNGDVMAYITPNADDSSMYNLYIQGDGSLYANSNSSYLFDGLYKVDSITGISKLNTSKVTNMNSMFKNTGSLSQVFTLNLGNNFDTSNVTNMRSMFAGTGYSSTEFTLDLGNKFDTSKVTDMYEMFSDMGGNSNILKLDLGDKFDTSNVETMMYMFRHVGCPIRQNDISVGDHWKFPDTTIKKDSKLIINLGNKFNTSKVTNMQSMFDSTGCAASDFELDLGDKFDTSIVTNMYSMFNYTGYNSTNFRLNLGDKFDTSNVTNMTFMFSDTGYSSTVFTLDLGNKFDTSKVTRMYYMFTRTGYKSPLFTLNLGDKFNTSEVTDMSYMFWATGYNSLLFKLDLGDKFDTSKVTKMYYMFPYVGNNNPSFTLDLGDKFDTSNVNDMSYMFMATGSNSSLFTLDLGDKFDTSNVTKMNSMFERTGENSPIFTLNLGNKFDTNNVTNMTDMFNKIGYGNENLTLNLSTINFNNVSDFSRIFDGMTTSKKIYVRDSTAQNWIINKSNNSNLTTSNVLIKN